MSAVLLRQLLALALLVVAVPYVVNQVRKPTRWVGRLLLSRMNQSHSDVTDVSVCEERARGWVCVTGLRG